MKSQSQVPSRKDFEYRARPAWRVQWPALLLLFGFLGLSLFAARELFGNHNLLLTDQQTGVVAAVLTVAVLVNLLIVIYRRYSWKFAMKGGRIESSHGIVAVDLHSIRLSDLRSIALKQSMMQRIFMIGVLEFSRAAGDGVEVTFWGVSKPKKVKRLAQRLEKGGP